MLEGFHGKKRSERQLPSKRVWSSNSNGKFRTKRLEETNLSCGPLKASRIRLSVPGRSGINARAFPDEGCRMRICKAMNSSTARESHKLVPRSYMHQAIQRQVLGWVKVQSGYCQVFFGRPGVLHDVDDKTQLNQGSSLHRS